MIESLNVSRTGRYEAKTTFILATIMIEASRQWKIKNLKNEAYRSLREAAGLNENELISSVVN
ncbi:MAG: hypothetical protein QXT72_02095 [Candidatus Micrarchaeia archaeon]